MSGAHTSESVVREGLSKLEVLDVPPEHFEGPGQTNIPGRSIRRTASQAEGKKTTTTV